MRQTLDQIYACRIVETNYVKIICLLDIVSHFSFISFPNIFDMDFNLVSCYDSPKTMWPERGREGRSLKSRWFAAVLDILFYMRSHDNIDSQLKMIIMYNVATLYVSRSESTHVSMSVSTVSMNILQIGFRRIGKSCVQRKIEAIWLNFSLLVWSLCELGHCFSIELCNFRSHVIPIFTYAVLEIIAFSVLIIDALMSSSLGEKRSSNRDHMRVITYLYSC